MRLEFKTIKPNNKSFIKRISLFLRSGRSIKLHLILDDDKDDPHTHPWDFRSLILFGGYREFYPGKRAQRFRWLSINTKHHSEYHNIVLNRVLNFKIPALTLGIYSKKNTLCSLCTKLGYCRTTGKPL